MELRHLRYFVAVAEEGHVTRAAERLGIQQPPLSLQIRALEREVGAPLFRRKPRGMELTAAGKAFLIDAVAILEHVDHAFTTTRRTARGEEGRIAIGFTSSAPFHPFVPRVIRALSATGATGNDIDVPLLLLAHGDEIPGWYVGVCRASRFRSRNIRI